jgi:hypothetical protein
MRRRVVFRDPEPLPEDAPEWADFQASIEGVRQKEISEWNMRQFDRLPSVTKRVEWATGNIDVAKQLVASGIRTEDEAEPVVRGMLEQRQKGRR